MMGLFPPVNGSRHLQRSPLLGRVINYISLLFSLTLPSLLPGSDKAGWMAFSSFLFRGLFISKASEGRLCFPSKALPQRACWGNYFRRHWKGAHDSTSKFFSSKLLVHQVF